MKKKKLITIIAVVSLLVGIPFICMAGEKTKTTTAVEPVEMVDMIWISPRGYLAQMNDWFLWVAINMGYFEQQGINLIMEPGPTDALATVKFVSEKQADVGWPSPGVLTAAIDTGMDVIGTFSLIPGQVFDFVVPADSEINTVQDLKGKTISVADLGWEVIIAPILAEQGMSMSEVTLVSGGLYWGQLVAEGQADAALSWIGNDIQWTAAGMDIKVIAGLTFSKQVSNCFASRKSDLDDPEKFDLLQRFYRATAMGLHFGKTVPAAAGQITYNQFPEIQEQMDVATAALQIRDLSRQYTATEREGKGYGYFPLEGFDNYLGIIAELGQTTKRLAIEDVASNVFIEGANDFDHTAVENDAKNYELNDEWKAIDTSDWGW